MRGSIVRRGCRPAVRRGRGRRAASEEPRGHAAAEGRCGAAHPPGKRGSSTTAGVAGGLVGALVFAAFAPFQCESCGKIPMSEFPPEVRSKARFGSLALVGGALLLLVLVVGLIVYINS